MFRMIKLCNSIQYFNMYMKYDMQQFEVRRGNAIANRPIQKKILGPCDQDHRQIDLYFSLWPNVLII